MKAVFTVITLSLFTIHNAGRQVTINFNFLPEVKDALKDQPIHVELRYNKLVIDTILINPSKITLTNVGSKYVSLYIWAMAPCTDSVSEKYFRVSDYVRVNKKETIGSVTFPFDCKLNRYLGGSICPVCNKRDQSIPIYWGLPSFDIKGEVGVDYELGGCTRSACDPSWYCKRDSLEF